MKNVLVDMLKAQGFTAAQSMEFACEHTLLSKKYKKQVQTCWYGEHNLCGFRGGTRKVFSNPRCVQALRIRSCA